MGNSITIEINHCARCGHDHKVQFWKFTGRPFEDANGIIYQWWGFCPETGDPVLMTNEHPELQNPTRLE